MMPPASVGHKWFALPVVSFQVLVSAALYAGLPAYPFAQLYVVAIFLASAFFHIAGVLASSASSVILLILFGYLSKGLPLPEPIDLAFQTGIYLVLGFLVANFRHDMLRNLEMMDNLKAKNSELLGIINSLTVENGELVEENARLGTVRDTTIQYVGSVAHDLRAPITAVKGNAQALLRTGTRLNVEKQREMLQSIVYAGNQLLNAVDNLLDASLIEAGHFALEQREVNLTSLVGDCIRMLSGSAGEHTIELNIAPDIPTVLADPENIGQVIVNLVTNAIKYSPPKSKILVKVEHNADFVSISVKDDGIGIAEEDMEHIFERYFRSGEAQIRQIKGTGLGLSISNEIVRGHGGEITVQSKPGAGSTFTFTLPILRGDATANAAQGDETPKHIGCQQVA